MRRTNSALDCTTNSNSASFFSTSSLAALISLWACLRFSSISLLACDKACFCASFSSLSISICLVAAANLASLSANLASRSASWARSASSCFASLASSSCTLVSSVCSCPSRSAQRFCHCCTASLWTFADSCKVAISACNFVTWDCRSSTLALLACNCTSLSSTAFCRMASWASSCEMIAALCTLSSANTDSRFRTMSSSRPNAALAFLKSSCSSSTSSFIFPFSFFSCSTASCSCADPPSELVISSCKRPISFSNSSISSFLAFISPSNAFNFSSLLLTIAHNLATAASFSCTTCCKLSLSARRLAFSCSSCMT
mmetsp:Transcript_75678/g.127250  ORF Transcript_75678/g.127250 Transcript_75678/m.127250 type:complete len:315 (-) Transcript_75678:2798-3742(-)